MIFKYIAIHIKSNYCNTFKSCNFTTLDIYIPKLILLFIGTHGFLCCSSFNLLILQKKLAMENIPISLCCYSYGMWELLCCCFQSKENCLVILLEKFIRPKKILTFFIYLGDLFINFKINISYIDIVKFYFENKLA